MIKPELKYQKNERRGSDPVSSAGPTYPAYEDVCMSVMLRKVQRGPGESRRRQQKKSGRQSMNSTPLRPAPSRWSCYRYEGRIFRARRRVMTEESGGLGLEFAELKDAR
jgi:hypothetical protein